MEFVVLKVKVQIGILECTGIVGQDLVHPYILLYSVIDTQLE